MIEHLVLIATGAGVGLSITLLCALLGLQSRYWSTFTTLNVTIGVVAALSSHTAVKRYSQSTRQSPIAPSELDRAIGALSERYAKEADRTAILTALYELREEVYGNR